jgi:hypothetical protein
MADAIFLNSTPFSIAVNLNGSESNSPIEPMSGPTSADPPTLTLHGAPYVIAANKSPDVFGASTSGNVIDNLLITFAPERGVTGIWHLQSTVSVALGLYFYLLDDQVIGVDQTGSSAGITIKRGNIGELRQFMERFFAVPRAFPKPS